LRRNRHDRIVLGVAGGLADYLVIDSLLIRLFFVVTAFAGGAGLLAYAALAIFLREDGDLLEHEFSNTSNRLRGRDLAMLLLLGAGTWWLAQHLGWWVSIDWTAVGPIMVVIVGLSLILKRDQRDDGSAGLG
jgi:phage shock protein PspC (stress-responsive transcriptional regulator)